MMGLNFNGCNIPLSTWLDVIHVNIYKNACLTHKDLYAYIGQPRSSQHQ